MFNFYHLLFLLFPALVLSAPAGQVLPEYQEQLIRVGIGTSDFKYLEYPSVSVTADSDFVINDMSTGSKLVEAANGTIYNVKLNNDGFIILNKGNVVVSKVEGPVEIEPLGGHVSLPDVKRQGKTPSYRGKFEIVRAQGCPTNLSAVNVLPLDDYLKGVVPNELPVSFGFEALKAQAVAARNYAIRPREKPYAQFDICDSVMCQVYFGYTSEHKLSSKAVDETAGLTALHNAEVITALYSSTAGGYSESYEHAFSDPVTGEFPAKSLPYLKGKPDDESDLDLSSEEAAEKFYTTYPDTYDVKSSFYRWNKTWTRPELEGVLNLNLSKLSNDKSSGKYVLPSFPCGKTIGTLKDIKVLSRGLSGKIREVQITGTNGVWVVQKELLIRRLFTKSGSALPSANGVFKIDRDSTGNPLNIVLFGGGFGHGVGMSQYGAGYMSGLGFKFDQILQHYYDHVAIGTEPVILYAGESTLPVKQNFYCPYGTATLWIDNEGISKIRVMINDKELILDEQSGDGGFKSIDISSYLEQGRNQVVYYPVESAEEEGISAKIWIEVVRAK